MDADLVEAFWHARHRVCGRRLRPLTLRHCLVLATADNPLITGGRLVTRPDILQAVEILSRPSRFFLEGKRPSWFARQWTAFWAFVERDSFLRITAYLSDYSSCPKIWKRDGAGGGVKSHWIVSTVAGLAHWLNVPVETAWEMTPGEAQHMLAAAIEQSPVSSIDIMSEAEKAVIAEIERERKEGGEHVG